MVQTSAWAGCKAGYETSARGLMRVQTVSAMKKPVTFRIRTHAQFERYKQAQGSAMIFAVPIQWLRLTLSFVQTCVTCVAGYLKARGASREEIGTRPTRLTCSRRACFSLCTAVSPLKQSISLLEGRRRRLYTSKAYLRARTNPRAR